MARARNIKPGFFKNDLLAECHPLARLLFAGLWCEADRDGRLEDRPKRLKAEYLPYDDCNIEALLAELVRHGFILRYQVAGAAYIAIPNFGKHQNPHMREPASSIPAPDEHSASTVQALDEHRTGPADSPSLIPDSSTEAYASAAGAAPEPEPDPIWGTGLAYLLRCRIAEKQARSLLGKLRQACGDVETGALLAQAEAELISDPAPWLMAAASKRRARAGPNGQPKSQTRSAAEILLRGTSDANLAERRNPQGLEQAPLLALGRHAAG